MELFNKILPMLWQIVEKHKDCAVNVSTFEDKLTVRILKGRKTKSFSHHDDTILIKQLQSYITA